jgi:hypothetical protein
VRRYRYLALIPAIGMLGGVPFANRVEPYVLGLPFLLFWITLWVVLTSGIMWLILVLDRARDRAELHAARGDGRDGAAAGPPTPTAE